ncbi:MAG: BatD family protein [Halopseudomonas sp.]
MARSSLSLICCTLLLLTLALSVKAEVSVTASTNQGRVGQPFELQIESAQFRSIIGGPQLGPLQQDFQIHSNKSVYLTEKRAGRTVFIARWTLSLSPKRAGSLQIPAIEVKQEWSQPQNIQVQPKPRPKAKPLILKALLNSPTAYQGGVINLSVKLYYNLALQSAELTQPKIEGARVELFGDQQSYTETLGSQNYQVIEQQYLVQADSAGRHLIPALHFNGTDGRGSAIAIESKPVEFNIMPLPNGLSAQPQLVASEVQLQQQWLQSFDNLRAGDTLTRSITLTAHGVPAQWLPDIQLANSDGVSVYPQTAQLQQHSVNGVLVSRKQIDFKLLLTQPGKQHLSEVSLHWWDSVGDKPQTAQLQAANILVQPFIGEAQDQEPSSLSSTNPKPDLLSTPSSSSQQDTQWQAWVWAGIALICALGWSLSVQRSKRLELELNTVQRAKTQEPVTAEPVHANNPHNTFSDLSEACHLNDPELAYHCLFEWATAHWPGMRVNSLADIEALANDPTLSYLLKNLEHQLSDPSDSWHGDLLLERLSRIRQQSRQSSSRQDGIRVAISD